MDSLKPTQSSPATATQHQVRLASPSDAQWLVDLSNHVQSALTSSGSPQELTPSTLETILAAITKHEIYLLISTSISTSSSSSTNPSLTTSSSECSPASETRIGSVTISPFSPSDGRGSSEWPISMPTTSSSKTTEPANQKHNSHSKTWYLNSLMLHPSHQGHGLGKRFLQEVFQLLGRTEGMGMVVLDCWAGNEKLRSFYEGVGCSLVGVFPELEYEIAVFEVGVGAGC
ncbi:acyl-CoA N-acyltransferase [Leptodontidium sp. 2 PMI_412]|nr:acyl-CoA N-acyltransferase [Leptodontidium sp. 2 PMI_412]